MSNGRESIQGKFGIELALARCGTAQWPLTLDLLRGRYDSSYMSGHSASDGLGALHRAFPVIRGVCIEVDTTKRLARIFDPYAPGEVDSEKWEALGGLIDRVPVVGTLGMKPMKATVAADLDADRLKDWMYQCRLHLDGKNGGPPKAIALVGGGYREWPSMEAIKKMPGKCRTNFYTGSMDGNKEYEHEVPVAAGA